MAHYARVAPLLVRKVGSIPLVYAAYPKRAQIVGDYLCEAGWNAQIAAAKQGSIVIVNA